MEDLTTHICWELVKKMGNITLWRKPLNNTCYVNHDAGVLPPICDYNDDPDNVWYADLRACITQLPENGYGVNLTTCPAHLHHPPNWLWSIKVDADISRKEIFMAESKYWNDIIDSYVQAFRWKEMNLRNVMDTKAGHGGCEPFDTYPRTHDLLHAAGLFSVEQERVTGEGALASWKILICEKRM